MSMLSEQVAALRKAAQCEGNMCNGLLLAAADTIETLAAKVRANNLHGGWIPVSERLPEKGQMIIAAYPEFEGGCWITKYNPLHNHDFKAWIPLPEPYQEGAEHDD